MVDWLNVIWNPHKAYAEAVKQKDLMPTAVIAVLIVALLAFLGNVLAFSSGGGIGAGLVIGLIVAILVLVISFIMAFIYHKVADILLNGKSSYIKMLSIVGFSGVPGGIGGIILVMALTVGMGMMAGGSAGAIGGLFVLAIGALIGIIFLMIAFASFIQGLKTMFGADIATSWSIYLIVVIYMILLMLMVFMGMIMYTVASSPLGSLMMGGYGA